MDGVIVDYATCFITHYNEKHGTDHRYEECTTHSLGAAFGVSDEEIIAFLRTYENEEVIAGLPAVEGAIDALTQLHSRYNIAIITSRKPEWEEPTRIWLAREFPHFVDLHFSGGANNPFAGGANRLCKPRIAEAIKALCLVEDNEHEFTYWDSEIVEPICFPQPWNRSVITTHPHVARLDWAAILDRYMK